MVNNFGEAIAAFVALPETAQPKELNTTNINREGAALHRKIVYFCKCKSNHHVAATISFDCISVPSPRKYQY